MDKNCTASNLTLYAVTNGELDINKLCKKVEDAIVGGITMLQLREKDSDFDGFLERATALNRLCKKHSIPFVVNDNVMVAQLSGADGVHVGQDDVSVSSARAILGQRAIIGATAHTLIEAERAEQEGADYLGIGAFFSSPTKSNTIALSHDTCKAITSGVSIPIVGIGGITKTNMMELMRLGLSGIALSSGIFAQQDITSACKELKKLAETLL